MGSEVSGGQEDGFRREGALHCEPEGRSGQMTTEKQSVGLATRWPLETLTMNTV